MMVQADLERQRDEFSNNRFLNHLKTTDRVQIKAQIQKLVIRPEEADGFNASKITDCLMVSGLRFNALACEMMRPQP